MRSLAITQNVTLDGSIEMLDDWFSPHNQGDVDNADLLAELRGQDHDSDALVLGRKTFLDFRGYWPEVSDDSTGIAGYLNQVRKYVASNTLSDPHWRNSTIISTDPVDAVRAMKHQPGKDIVITGSITLCHALIGGGLVDEYRLFGYPAVQGRGRPLFPAGCRLPALRLREAKSFRCGVTFSRYTVR